MEISLDLPSILAFANLILSSAIVIIAFSLLVYILTHNLRSAVARSFCALIAFVTVVYVGDIALPRIETLEAAIPWLRFQWLGIAFVPAAYLHFSDTLLRTTNLTSPWRWRAVLASYLVSALLFGLAVSTDLLVHDGRHLPQISHLAAGPLFWVFALYFLLTVAWGAQNIRRARQRCLTSTSRRRMTYLGMAFAAPGLGVFPYLVAASMPSPLMPGIVLFLSLAGNVGVALMIVVMAYSVAYFGVLTPDRVIKHSFIHYLLRGPFVATCAIILMLTIPQAERIFGLPRDMVLIFALVGLIVTSQIFINLAKPFIDRLIYRQDREEITWIQELDKRLLTTTDLKQFLENVLTALCELLRVQRGFVAVMAGGEPCVEAFCGPFSPSRLALNSADLIALAQSPSNSGELDNSDFVVHNGYWLLPLRTESRESTLGVLGVDARFPEPDLTEDELEVIRLLIAQAELALEDRHLQQGVFDALRRIIPQIEYIQRWRGTIRYLGSPGLETIEEGPLYGPDFQQWVWDALNHYWGGPKLTKSPLLNLKVVERALEENDGNPAKALRSVLDRAIEALKPEGERRMTTAEWILYNILELKFIQGLRVKDIAMRLAMSESDLYRKQRVAIEEVAKTIADMEQGATEHRARREEGPGPS
ncbi:MAG: histidine kinase N-terminal 7TM domain-containing protein [Anaerolineae bacterium]